MILLTSDRGHRLDHRAGGAALLQRQHHEEELVDTVARDLLEVDALQEVDPVLDG